MKMYNQLMKTVWMVAATVLLASAGARAQGDAGGPPPPLGPGQHVRMIDDEIGFMGFEAGLGGKTVTGAPFSATISTQSSQTLADANQIQRSTTGSFARDSQGRTRREMTLPAIGPLAAAAGKTPPHAIFISDPVARTSYILHADEKTADQMPVRAWKGQKEGPSPALRPDRAGRFENEKITTDLGTQNINGVSAQGTRVTRTIAAGEIGNAKPIVITTERWYSTELQAYVMIKRTDPMMGDVTYQLTNIQRAEPEASLFQLPADYTVNQRSPRGAARKGMTPPPPPEQ